MSTQTDHHSQHRLQNADLRDRKWTGIGNDSHMFHMETTESDKASVGWTDDTKIEDK